MTLLAISPGDGRDLQPWIEALAEAGLPALSLREPHLAEPLAMALWRFAAHRVPEVFVHLKTPGAARLLAEGASLHLPAAEPVGTWRARVRGRLLVSCHDDTGLQQAFAQGADLALLSPVWPPLSKPDDDRPTLGPKRFLALAAHRPVLALGGVTPERHHHLRARGAFGSAVLGGLFGAPDPTAAATRLQAWLDAGPRN